LGIVSIRKLVKEQRRALILLAMAGAYVFVLSSLKIPSVTGSCSHMTGTGLSSILFGVGPTSVLAIIVLIFQAILLAHGGLTTLGANNFSMGIAGPILTFLLYQLGKKMNINRKVNIFLAAALGDLFTYCVTSVQLAIAYPSETGGIAASAVKFLAVFAPTQLPLAIIEGILTVLVIMGMESFAASELKEIGYLEA
jgi:cobalt/nickel transport system permease protein